MQVLFRTLGPLAVHTPEVRPLGTGKPADVLATLLQQPNALVGVDRLIEAVWPGTRPASAAANLKTYVWQLRRMLPDLDGAGRIERHAGAYRLRVAPGEIDADRVRALAAAARRPGRPAEEALDLVREALSWFRGHPYAGLDSAAGAAAALEELRLQLQEQLADRQLELGRADQAEATLRDVLAVAPLRETAWAQLIHALHRAGRRSDALVACRQAAGLLDAELGVAPGPALVAAERLVRAAGGRRELPRDVRLRGRAAELAALRRAATGPAPVIVLEGPAGIGKTALAVHAAHRLAAAYPDGQFFVALRDPAAVLARLLRGVGVPAADVPAEESERAALWRSEVARRRVLLVLDDAAEPGRVWPLLPAGPGGLTLITARRPAEHLDGAVRVPLGPLGPVAAADLFAAAGGIGGAAAVRSCGGNPAALLRAATARGRVAR